MPRRPSVGVFMVDVTGGREDGFVDVVPVTPGEIRRTHDTFVFPMSSGPVTLHVRPAFPLDELHAKHALAKHGSREATCIKLGACRERLELDGQHGVQRCAAAAACSQPHGSTN